MNQLNIFDKPTNLFDKEEASGKMYSVKNGTYWYYPCFFNSKESNAFFTELKNNILWRQESMNIYGKQVNFPRLTAWYGDNNKPYSFSGITLNPHAWTTPLLSIKNKIEPKCNVVFNSVLLNLYRNGNDSISWHTDAEPELGKNPVIASVNFGETRVFQLRHIQTKEKIEIELSHGSLLIMEGELQHFWQHQVPKTSKQVNERINLTFRVIR